MSTQRPSILSLVPSLVPTVMVIEDAETNLIMYTRILEHSGYRVLPEDSTVGAFATLARETPDAILLDYMLPGMDGPTFLRILRADPRLADIPVVMLTASSSEAHIEVAFAAGANDYLVKPVATRILVERLKSIIEARRGKQKASLARIVRQERDALLREVEDARQLQSSSLPACPMVWDGWEVSGALLAAGNVGGDLFDIILSEAARTIVLIDVSGHGLAAAMVAASVRSSLRFLLGNGYEPSAALEQLNTHLCEQNNLYACVALVHVEATRITIVNAGLPPVAIYLAAAGAGLLDAPDAPDAAAYQLVGPHGIPPGLVPGSVYESSQIERQPGICIAVVSDGLTEPFGAADDTPGALRRLRGSETSGALDRRLLDLFPNNSAEDDATVVVVCDTQLSGAPRNRLAFKIQAVLEQVPAASARVRAFCSGNRITLDEECAIELCLAEALNNAVEHACGNDPAREITIDVSRDEIGLVFAISEFGTAIPDAYFDQSRASAIDFDPADVPTIPERGYGLAILRQLTDAIRYSSHDRRNTLTLVKHFRSGPPTSARHGG